MRGTLRRVAGESTWAINVIVAGDSLELLWDAAGALWGGGVELWPGPQAHRLHVRGSWEAMSQAWTGLLVFVEDFRAIAEHRVPRDHPTVVRCLTRYGEPWRSWILEHLAYLGAPKGRRLPPA